MNTPVLHQNALLEGILNSANYTIISTNLKGTILTFNAAAEKMLGYSADEVIGKMTPEPFHDREEVFQRANELSSELGRPIEPGFEVFVTLAREQERPDEREWTYIRKDGSRFPVLLSVTAIRDSKGKLAAYLGIGSDLTERKKSVEQTMALRLRDEFLSIASHELKTPLTPLRLSLQTLIRHLDRNGLAKMPPDYLRNALMICDRQVGRISSLIENLLDVSRITAGKLTLNPETIDLCSLVQDIVERYAPQALEAHCPIQTQLPSHAPGLWDPLRLEQVIINLLTNALRYAKGSPISLKIEKTAQNGFQLIISDQGPGIDPKDQLRIFERFERGCSQHNIGGMGLGLYISRQIISAHGGSLDLMSELGKGSTFTVTLPEKVV